MLLTPHQFLHSILPVIIPHNPLFYLTLSLSFISLLFIIVSPPIHVSLNTIFSSWFWNLYKSNYAVYIWDLFLLLNIMSHSCNYVAIVCLFYCMNILQFIFPFNSGLLGCFQPGGITHRLLQMFCTCIL